MPYCDDAIVRLETEVPTPGGGRVCGIVGVDFDDLVELFGLPETWPPDVEHDGKIDVWWCLYDREVDVCYTVRNYKVNPIKTRRWTVAFLDNNGGDIVASVTRLFADRGVIR